MATTFWGNEVEQMKSDDETGCERASGPEHGCSITGRCVRASEVDGAELISVHSSLTIHHIILMLSLHPTGFHTDVSLLPHTACHFLQLSLILYPEEWRLLNPPNICQTTFSHIPQFTTVYIYLYIYIYNVESTANTVICCLL
jgi:hypothetical protein